jgi:hypothetical protein
MPIGDRAVGTLPPVFVWSAGRVTIASARAHHDGAGVLFNPLVA